MDRNKIQRPHPKYYLGEYYKTCWNCGAHGHYKEACPKKRAQTLRNREFLNKQKHHANHQRNSNSKNSQDINIADYIMNDNVFPCKGPGKSHLAWVSKQ